MKFEEFKKKYFGKDLEYISKELQQENFWKRNNDIISVCLGIDNLIENIIKIEKKHPSIFLLQKRMLILKYVFETFSTLESFPDSDIAEDYDILVEQAIYKLFPEANFVRQMVEDGINELNNIVIENLYQIFNNKTPSTESLKELAEEVNNIFKDKSSEELDLIKNILDFNDPTLKEIRNNIYNNAEINQIQADVENREN